MKVHFVGLGGIGVSALAKHFFYEGHSVSGSDISGKSIEEKGISYFKGHSGTHVPDDADLVIYSPAVEEDNVEVVRAREMGVKVQSYPEALGDLTERYYTVAVSGTHGKSTTTAMLSLIMTKAGLDPTVIVGTKLKEFNGSNYRRGKSKYLLIEADEFKASFLNYKPQLCVLNNIEEDHLDYYKDLEEIVRTFEKYLRKVEKIVANKDDENVFALLKKWNNVTWYNFRMKKPELSVPGKHNVYNALAALTASKELKIKRTVALEALKEFKGSWRRFEEKKVTLKNDKKITLINDYAHHPTEVKATIEAAREKYPHKKMVAVFQPHQYDRSYKLFDKFQEALSSLPLDQLFITDIFTVSGRESEGIKEKVNAEMMSNAVEQAAYSGDLAETGKKLLEGLQGGEVVVIMGAGDIPEMEKMIVL